MSREALAPFLKNEEARLMAESSARRSPFQYILCVATSPAVKQQEETLTYLNQGKQTSVPCSSLFTLSTLELMFRDGSQQNNQNITVQSLESCDLI